MGKSSRRAGAIAEGVFDKDDQDKLKGGSSKPDGIPQRWERLIVCAFQLDSL